jgi:DNA-binding CsgD family transcriptional regulator
MYLHYRLTEVCDLEFCYPFIQDRYHYDDSFKKDVLSLWKTLLEDGCCLSHVIEDRDQPPGQRHVGIGISMFATDRFMEQAKTDLPPFLPLQVLDKWKKGIRPFLKKEEVREAQAGQGLNMLVLHVGWDGRRYNREGFSKIRQFHIESFVTLLRGFRCKDFAEEIYETQERDMILNMGCEIYRDYREFVGTKYLPKTDERHYPYLVGITSEAARKKTGTTTAAIAFMGPARFHFNSGEQEILKRALADETDEEIAQALCLSLITVKKRWQGIYDKVETVDKELLAQASRDTGKNGRLKQRRRFLLKHLREHPYELWPETTPH